MNRTALLRQKIRVLLGRDIRHHDVTGSRKYMCPVCNRECDTILEARRHAKIPVTTPALPLGLVLRSYITSDEALGKGRVTPVELERHTRITDHRFAHYQVIVESTTGWRHQPIYVLVSTLHGDGYVVEQDMLIPRIREGESVLLSETEFRNFQDLYPAAINHLRRQYGIPAAVRTCAIPGLSSGL